MWTTFSSSSHLMTFEELRLGFPKRPYIWKSTQMATRSEPLKNVDRDSGLLTSRQLSALFRSTSIIQWFATVHHMNWFWKVRVFWKAAIRHYYRHRAPFGVLVLLWKAAIEIEIAKKNWGLRCRMAITWLTTTTTCAAPRGREATTGRDDIYLILNTTQ